MRYSFFLLSEKLQLEERPGERHLSESLGVGSSQPAAKSRSWEHFRQCVVWLNTSASVLFKLLNSLMQPISVKIFLMKLSKRNDSVKGLKDQDS